MKGSLTDKQAGTLCYIIEHLREHRRSPSLQEVARNQGISVVAAYGRMFALRGKGIIEFGGRKKCAIRIIEPCFVYGGRLWRQVLDCGEKVLDNY